MQYDPNDPNILNEVVEHDPEGDHYAKIPPIPGDRRYRVTAKLSPNAAIELRRQKKEGKPDPKGKGFVYAPISLTVVDPGGEYDKRNVFDNLMSVVRDRTKTSALHAFLKEVGYPAQPSMILGELASHVEQVLLTEPSIEILVEWEAQVKDADGTYRDVLKKYTQFPLMDPADKDGPRNPLITDKKTGQEIMARERVERYFAIGA